MRKSTLFAVAAAFMATAGAFSANAQTKVDYTLSPAAGAATDLMTIELNFNDQFVAFYENSTMPVAVLENTTTGAVYYCQDADRNAKAEAVAGYTLTFIGEDESEALPITQPGDYTLTVRAMYIPSEDGDDETIAPITANYTITYPVKYVLTPAAGVVTDLSTVSVEFPANRNIEFYENNRMPVAVLENLTTGESYLCESATRNTFAQTDGIVYDLTFVAEGEEEVATITATGAYVLTIKGLCLVGEEDVEGLPVITAAYEIKYPVAYTLTPDPSAPVTNLTTVTVDFTENKNIAFYESNRMPIAVLENLTTGAVYNCQEADRNAHAMTDGIAYDLTFIGEDAEEVEPITAPGEYLLTIRGLGYEEDGEMGDALPVIVANYTVAYPVDYVLYPLGNVATNLKTVSIEFAENNVEFYENNQMPVAVLENLETGAVYNCQEATRNTFAMTDGIAYDLTFVPEDSEEAEDITEPGIYHLTIRALKQVDENGEDVDLPVIYKTYTIVYPYDYVLEPASGSVVEDLSNISLEFTADKVVFYENSRMAPVILENVETGVEYVCNEPTRDTRAMTEGTKWNFTFEDEEGEIATITASGNYKLTIKGLYIEDENGEAIDVPAIYAEYVISYPEYVLNPHDGQSVEDLEYVYLEFPTTKNVMFYENNRMPVATLENTMNDMSYICQEAERNVRAETDGIAYILHFADAETEEYGPIFADGVYNLTIRGLAIVDDENGIIGDFPVITATYYIADSGVKAAEMIGADVYNVYNLNGVKVISNGNADSLNNLSKGLYIVNGKKVVITK